jgi:ATP synthase protein I
VLGPGGGRDFRTFARLGSVGIELAVATIIGLAGGHWLDGKLGTGPWLTLVGLLVGVAAGFKNLIETARKAQREGDRRDQKVETDEKTQDSG